MCCDRVLLGEVLDCLPILNFDSWKIGRRQDLFLAFGGRIRRMDRWSVLIDSCLEDILQVHILQQCLVLLNESIKMIFVIILWLALLALFSISNKLLLLLQLLHLVKSDPARVSPISVPLFYARISRLLLDTTHMFGLFLRDDWVEWDPLKRRWPTGDFDVIDTRQQRADWWLIYILAIIV